MIGLLEFCNLQLHIYHNDTFAQITTKVSRWSMEQSYRKLVKPAKRVEFGVAASTVNAFYSSLKNAIGWSVLVVDFRRFKIKTRECF